jgi:hypothetical protein
MGFYAVQQIKMKLKTLPLQEVSFNSQLTYNMTTFTEYLQNIHLTVFDYLCDIIISNSDDEDDFI